MSPKCDLELDTAFLRTPRGIMLDVHSSLNFRRLKLPIVRLRQP